MELTDRTTSSIILLESISFDLVNNSAESDQTEGQITSQMILVCCWRTIKEISLLFSRLGQIGMKYILNDQQYRFISLKQVLQKGFNPNQSN